MSRNLQEMHRSVGKITDENVLLFSSQTKFTLQKAAIVKLFMWKEKGLHTSVPISHFKTLQLFYFFNVLYVMNRTVIFQTYWNTLDADRVSDISEHGVIIKWSERGGEIVCASLHSHTLIGHVTQMWLFVNEYRRILHRVTAHYQLQNTL